MNKLTIYFAGQRYEKYFIYASARVQVREFYPIFVIFYTTGMMEFLFFGKGALGLRQVAQRDTSRFLTVRRGRGHVAVISRF